MLYAWIDGVKRAPLVKGEKTICPDCGGILTSVFPSQNIKHWRHKAGDCDSWSEPEGEWHLSWKEHFPIETREISMIDELSGERHRADIFCSSTTARGKILELQHSNISDQERISRELFYGRNHEMFWLVHIHSDTSFNEFAFESALSTSKEQEYAGRKFMIATWVGRSNQFIEKWKNSDANVFFDWKGYVFYLAGSKVAQHLYDCTGRGRFAVCALTKREFIDAVSGKNQK